MVCYPTAVVRLRPLRTSCRHVIDLEQRSIISSNRLALQCYSKLCSLRLRPPSRIGWIPDLYPSSLVKVRDLKTTQRCNAQRCHMKISFFHCTAVRPFLRCFQHLPFFRHVTTSVTLNLCPFFSDCFEPFRLSALRRDEIIINHLFFDLCVISPFCLLN